MVQSIRSRSICQHAAPSSRASTSDAALLRFAVEVRDDALYADVRQPGGFRWRARSPLGGLRVQLVEALAKRWCVDDAGGSHLWVEIDAA
jgi:hypothetical protein